MIKGHEINSFKILKVLCFLAIASSPLYSHYVSPSDFYISKTHKIKVYENFPINQLNTDIERVVIVVHGIARNADEYFDFARTAAQIENVEGKTLILAPHFKTESDPLEPDELFWNNSWKFGDLSAFETVSSYEVLDQIVEKIWLEGHFPSLRKISFIGHSAGGQTIARYAAGSPIIDRYPLNISYIVSNPSSYLYFRPERFDQIKGFAVPNFDCAEYDSYPYGTGQPNSYMGKVSSQELQLRFNHRDVTLLLGEEDKLSDYLDTSCEANLQGKTRIERGQIYHRFIKTFYPESRLKLKTVPKVGHSGKDMIQSKAARELLFH